MGDNDMTDVMNLRKLASLLRKKGFTTVPQEDETLLGFARDLRIADWAESLMKKNNGAFYAMLAFHLMDCGDAA